MRKIFGPRAALNKMTAGKVVVELCPMTDDESNVTYRRRRNFILVRFAHGSWNRYCHIEEFFSAARGDRFKEKS